MMTESNAKGTSLQRLAPLYKQARTETLHMLIILIGFRQRQLFKEEHEPVTSTVFETVR